MIEHIHRFTVPAAYALLPPQMHSDHATAMLLAIGLQESVFTARRQHPGPARGFWQFELKGALRGVLEHQATKAYAAVVIDALHYRVPKGAAPARQALELYEAITHNDTLACCLARLLLWTLPKPLPNPDDTDGAFRQYIEAWQPGAYEHGTEGERIRIRSVWRHNYAEAWTRVYAAQISEIGEG